MSPERQSGRLAAVIPAYDEAATIRDVAERTLAQLAKVIVVDDGSSDGTARELAGLPVTLIRNPRNLRQSASLWRGPAPPPPAPPPPRAGPPAGGAASRSRPRKAPRRC